MKQYRFYDRTTWTAPLVSTSSHVAYSMATHIREIDVANGNDVVATASLLVMIQNNNPDSGETVTVTPKVSGTLRDGASSFVATEKTFTLAPGAGVVLGPFSNNYRFSGKLQFDWALGGTAEAAEVDVYLLNVGM
jgi:hypothetical protein